MAPHRAYTAPEMMPGWTVPGSMKTPLAVATIALWGCDTFYPNSVVPDVDNAEENARRVGIWCKRELSYCVGFGSKLRFSGYPELGGGVVSTGLESTTPSKPR